MSASNSSSSAARLCEVSRQYLRKTVRPNTRASRATVQIAESSSSGSSSRTLHTSASTGQNGPSSHLGPLASRSPTLYDALRPRPKSTYIALAHRLKLITKKTDEQTTRRRLEALIQACTHPSFSQLASRTLAQYGDEARTGGGKGLVRYEGETRSDEQYLDSNSAGSNESLTAVGNTTLGLIASEHLHLRYPNLPNRVLKAALSAYAGPNTLADVATELGIAARGVVRWDRGVRELDIKTPHLSKTVAKTQKERLLSRDVHADALRSIVAVMLQEQGLSTVRTFVETHLLSRTIPLLSLLKFEDPKRTLSLLCQKLNRERPQSRMIAETGRLSISPVFVVGVYSGTEKLGEGTGSAIRMAEFRAAEDALRRFYLNEMPLSQISLPSVTLDSDLASTLSAEEEEEGQRTVWNIDHARVPGRMPSFEPSKIGHSEVVFGSRA